jgi:Gram-negative bacterial TonB protein C-terminal
MPDSTNRRIVSARALLLPGIVALASVFLTLSLQAAPPEPVTPRSVLDKGIAVTGLTGGPAWHIKANYNLYDRGNLTESGTLEEWATGPWTWHRVYTEKKVSGSEWSVTRADHAQTKESKVNFAMLDSRVATPLTSPLYQAANFTPDSNLDGKAGTFAGVILDCINVKDAVRSASKVNPDLLYPMYCFDVKDATLRYAKTTDTLISYSDFKPLDTRSVATKMDVNYGGKTSVSAEITTLEPLSAADQAQVAPSGKTVPQPYMHQASDAPLVPARLGDCAYPMSAMNAQEHGTVMIPVIVKKDGSVKNNGGGFGTPFYGDLVGAGSDCVGNWKFEPFLIDGKPADVGETFIITFNGGPFKGAPGYASQPAAPPAK